MRSGLLNEISMQIELASGRTLCEALHEKQIEMLDVPLVEFQFLQNVVRRVFQQTLQTIVSLCRDGVDETVFSDWIS